MGYKLPKSPKREAKRLSSKNEASKRDPNFLQKRKKPKLFQATPANYTPTFQKPINFNIKININKKN